MNWEASFRNSGFAHCHGGPERGRRMHSSERGGPRGPSTDDRVGVPTDDPHRQQHLLTALVGGTHPEIYARTGLYVGVKPYAIGDADGAPPAARCPPSSLSHGALSQNAPLHATIACLALRTVPGGLIPNHRASDYATATLFGIGAGASTRLEDTDPVPQTISQTSRCVGERTEAAGNDDRRPSVTATRMVFAAYNGKIVPWGCLQADGPTGPGIGGGEDCHRGVFGWILSVVIGKHFSDLIV